MNRGAKNVFLAIKLIIIASISISFYFEYETMSKMSAVIVSMILGGFLREVAGNFDQRSAIDK